jgi:spore coat protein U-like protein
MRWSNLVIAVCVAALSSPAASQCVCSCSVTTVGVAFGAYNPLPGAASDATGSVTNTCTITAGILSYTVALSAGGSASYSPRHMSSGVNRLNYNLTVDSARTIVWGDGSGGTQMQSDATGLGVLGNYAKTYSVYGRILANQSSAVPGSYSDSIIVTVTY